MTDERLDADFDYALRSVLQRLAPADTPVALRTKVAAVTDVQPRARWNGLRLATFTAVAAAIVVAVLAGTFLLLPSIGRFGQPSDSPTPVPSPTSVLSPSPSIISRTITFHLTADGGMPTHEQKQAVSEILQVRALVYDPAGAGIEFGNDGLNDFTVTIGVPSDEQKSMDDIAATLAAPGNVTFVPIGFDGPQPTATIDPALTPLFDGADVASANLGTNLGDGQPTLEITLAPVAAQRFANWTKDNFQSQLAIVVDGRIEAAPVIQAVFPDGRMAISGGASDGLKRIRAVLNSGPLPQGLVLVVEPVGSPLPN